MILEILPSRTAGAAENMAIDFLLLQRYPRPATPRFRRYAWRAPAFTFGYAQKIAFVRSCLPPGEACDLCRRPTGGGLVDHREDWTYAVVIPRGHPLEEVRATQSYRAIHAALAEALQEQDVDAELQAVADEADAAGTGVCFQRAEIHDVVHRRTGEKIAGAAQKRNRHGLLFQGSIWRPATGRPDLDWDRFADAFPRRLATALGASPQPTPWPEFDDEEVSALSEQYSSPEWIDYR